MAGNTANILLSAPELLTQSMHFQMRLNIPTYYTNKT